MVDVEQLSVVIEAKGAQAGGDKVNAILKQIEANTKRTSDVVEKSFGGKLPKNLQRSTMGLLSFKGALASLGIATVGKAIIDTNAEFQRLNASLITITGSADAAKAAMGALQDLASSTPFSLRNLTQAFITLRTGGLTATEEALTSYGNLASAFGRDITDVTHAVRSAMTGEMEALKSFGIVVKQTTDSYQVSFKGNTQEIKKDARELEQVLLGIGATEFAGQMANQMDTLSGRWSNLGDNVDRLFVAIGEGGLNEALSDLLDYLIELTSSGDGTAAVIGSVLGGAVDVLTTVLRGLVWVVDKVSGAIEDLMAVEYDFMGVNLTVAETIELAWQGIQIAIETVVDWLSKEIDKTAKMMGDGAQAAADAFTSPWEEMSEHIGNLIRDLINKLIGFGVGIAEVAGTVKRSFEGVFTGDIIDFHAEANAAFNKAFYRDYASELFPRDSIANALELGLASVRADKFKKRLEEEYLPAIQDFGKKAAEGLGLGFLLKGGLSGFGSGLGAPPTRPKKPVRAEPSTLGAEVLGMLERDALPALQSLEAAEALEEAFAKMRTEAELAEGILNLKGAGLDSKELAVQIELLKKRKELGLTDPEEIAQLEDLVRKTVELGFATKELNETQENAAKAAEEARKKELEALEKQHAALKGFIRQNIDFWGNLESVAVDALTSITDALAELIATGKTDFTLKDFFQNFLKTALGVGLRFGVASLTGGIGALGFHGGGVVGETTPAFTRNVSPHLFAGAPRYHQGGIAGLRPGEVPAILERGEPVLPKGTPLQRNITINQFIQTPNAESFNRSQRQRMRQEGRALRRILEDA